MPAAEIRVTLPDGSRKVLPAGATAADLAKAIGPGLAKAALAAKVDGEVRDLARPLPDGVAVELLTDKHPQALDVLRHSTAHVLATAVRQLFPHARIGFGPPIEDGFYYDFEVPTPFTPEDLARIEAKMAEVTAADYPFVRAEVDRAEAKRRFTDDPLKLERIDDLGPDEVYVSGGSRVECAGWGEILTQVARTRGAAGAVIDGYHRDTKGIVAQGWPVFSRGPYAQDSRVRSAVLDFRLPIEIGGVIISPGDLMIGDVDGVVVVPSEIEAETIELALAKVAAENTVLDDIRNGMTATEAFARHGVL